MSLSGRKLRTKRNTRTHEEDGNQAHESGENQDGLSGRCSTYTQREKRIDEVLAGSGMSADEIAGMDMQLKHQMAQTIIQSMKTHDDQEQEKSTKHAMTETAHPKDHPDTTEDDFPLEPLSKRIGAESMGKNSEPPKGRGRGVKMKEGVSEQRTSRPKRKLYKKIEMVVHDVLGSSSEEESDKEKENALSKKSKNIATAKKETGLKGRKVAESKQVEEDILASVDDQVMKDHNSNEAKSDKLSQNSTPAKFSQKKQAPHASTSSVGPISSAVGKAVEKLTPKVGTKNQVDSRVEESESDSDMSVELVGVTPSKLQAVHRKPPAVQGKLMDSGSEEDLFSSQDGAENKGVKTNDKEIQKPGSTPLLPEAPAIELEQKNDENNLDDDETQPLSPMQDDNVNDEDTQPGPKSEASDQKSPVISRKRDHSPVTDPQTEASPAKRPYAGDTFCMFDGLPGFKCSKDGPFSGSPPPRKLINKWRQKKRFVDRRPQYHAGKGTDPIQQAKLNVQRFDQYRVQLREAQAQVLDRIPWGKPVKVGYHMSKTLDVKGRGQQSQYCALTDSDDDGDEKVTEKGSVGFVKPHLVGGDCLVDVAYEGKQIISIRPRPVADVTVPMKPQVSPIKIPETKTLPANYAQETQMMDFDDGKDFAPLTKRLSLKRPEVSKDRGIEEDTQITCVPETQMWDDLEPVVANVNPPKENKILEVPKHSEEDPIPDHVKGKVGRGRGAKRSRGRGRLMGTRELKTRAVKENVKFDMANNFGLNFDSGSEAGQNVEQDFFADAKVKQLKYETARKMSEDYERENVETDGPSSPEIGTKRVAAMATGSKVKDSKVNDDDITVVSHTTPLKRLTNVRGTSLSQAQRNVLNIRQSQGFRQLVTSAINSIGQKIKNTVSPSATPPRPGSTKQQDHQSDEGSDEDPFNFDQSASSRKKVRAKVKPQEPSTSSGASTGGSLLRKRAAMEEQDVENANKKAKVSEAAQPGVACPMCFKQFSEDQIQQHASTCQGQSSQESHPSQPHTRSQGQGRSRSEGSQGHLTSLQESNANQGHSREEDISNSEDEWDPHKSKTGSNEEDSEDIVSDADIDEASRQRRIARGRGKRGRGTGRGRGRGRPRGRPPSTGGAARNIHHRQQNILDGYIGTPQASPASRATTPTATEICPMCEKRVPVEIYQQHVPDCVNRNEAQGAIAGGDTAPATRAHADEDSRSSTDTPMSHEGHSTRSTTLADDRSVALAKLRAERERRGRKTKNENQITIDGSSDEEFDENQPINPKKRAAYFQQKANQPLKSSQTSNLDENKSSDIETYSSSLSDEYESDSGIGSAVTGEKCANNKAGNLSPFKAFQPISKLSNVGFDFKNQFKKVDLETSLKKRQANLSRGKKKRKTRRRRKGKKTTARKSQTKKKSGPVWIK